MLFKAYKSTTLQGTRGDISSSVIDISNLGWKRDLDYGYVLPHPTITTTPDLSVSKGDYIHIEIDSEIRFCTYVDEIEEPPDGQSKILKCWDIIKKLEDTYIMELSTDSWWSSDSWWTALSTAQQEELYQYSPLGGDQSTKRYISALFLIQVMMKHCCGFDLSSAQTAQMNTENSNFQRFVNPGYTAVTYERLLFQFKQVKAVGGSSFVDEIWERATCLEVFHWIIRTLEIKFTYETVGGDVEFILHPYGTPSVPSADDDGYSPRDLQQYDGVTVKLTYLDDLYDYSAAWPTPESDTENKPTDPSSGDKYKTITLPAHFMLHYKVTGTSTLVPFIASNTFLIQYAEVLEDIYTTEWKKKTFDMQLEEERDLLEINYDLKKSIAKMVYLDEVT